MRQKLSSADLCDIGRRIRELRRERGLNQEEVAELCDLSTSLIGHIERGEKAPSLGTLMTFSRVFGVSLDRLAWGRADALCDGKRCPLHEDLTRLIAQYSRQI